MNRNIRGRAALLAATMAALALGLLNAAAGESPLDKARAANDKATEAADQAQKNTDLGPKNANDKAAEKADKKAEDDENAARAAQDKADQSQAEKDAGKPGTTKQAAEDAQAAEKAWGKAQESEKAAKKADDKADKGEDKDNPQKINRKAQREKRDKAQDYYDKLRKSKGYSLGPRRAPETFASLTSTGKLKAEVAGTGETIGKVATLTVTNLTGAALVVAVPALVLESANGKSQDYACPRGQTVALGPHEARTVPLKGNCLVRSKPPVGDGVAGELVARDSQGHALNVSDFPEGETPVPHLDGTHLGKLLRVAKSYDSAAEKLEKKGAFKDMPYSDPEMRKNIVKQWGPWMDPNIAEVTGGKPATKEDLKKTVYKQAEEHSGPLTKQTKAKLDDGIDQLFKGIQLASKEAKNLEEPAPADTVTISDETPKPTTEKAPEAKPLTDEKPKDKGDKTDAKDAGKTPPPATKEKKPKAKPRTPIEEAFERWEEANKAFGEAWRKFARKSYPRFKTLEKEMEGTEETDQGWSDRLHEWDKLAKQIDEDFAMSREGQDLRRKIRDAEDEMKRLNDLEKQRKDKVKEALKKMGITPNEKPKSPDDKPAPSDPDKKSSPGSGVPSQPT